MDWNGDDSDRSDTFEYIRFVLKIRFDFWLENAPLLGTVHFLCKKTFTNSSRDVIVSM